MMNNALPHLHSARRQGGVTIIEVMIAVLLGLFITGAIVSAFVATGRHYAHDEQMGRMQESARFALRMLADDLSLSDFWGILLSPEAINSTSRSCLDTPDSTECLGISVNSNLQLSTDCAPTGADPNTNWAYDLTAPIEVLQEGVDGATANAEFSCIDPAEFQPGTDVVALKHVRGKELASSRIDQDHTGKVFMRTDGSTGMLFVYDHETNGSLIQSSGVSDWQYLTHVYYVRRDSMVGENDGVPTLYRRVLNGTDMQIESGGIARGIEFYRIMFGIDTDTDGIPNTYISVPTAEQMLLAVTARIYVLARSTDPDFSYINDKSYVLGDKTISGGNDNYYRRVFSTTVKLRNSANRILLQVAGS